jgi:hypothetical protein
MHGHTWHATHTWRCVAAAAPDLRTLAGLPGRRDIADFFESQRARGSGATAHREGRESGGGLKCTHILACNHTCALKNPHAHTHAHTGLGTHNLV